MRDFLCMCVVALYIICGMTLLDTIEKFKGRPETVGNRVAIVLMWPNLVLKAFLVHVGPKKEAERPVWEGTI